MQHPHKEHSKIHGNKCLTDSCHISLSRPSIYRFSTNYFYLHYIVWVNTGEAGKTVDASDSAAYEDSLPHGNHKHEYKLTHTARKTSAIVWLHLLGLGPMPEFVLMVMFWQVSAHRNHGISYCATQCIEQARQQAHTVRSTMQVISQPE